MPEHWNLRQVWDEAIGQELSHESNYGLHNVHRTVGGRPNPPLRTSSSFIYTLHFRDAIVPAEVVVSK